MAVQSSQRFAVKQAALQCATFPTLSLQYGGSLEAFTLAYETWGTLNARRDNAILITHALTGSSHAYDEERPDDPKAAWWNPLIGPGRPFDTEQYFIICSNVLGGCYGSTGPSSPDPRTGGAYNMRFPLITIGDMVRAQRQLIAHLGIRKLTMVVGGSIGGQQALEWAVTYPDLVDRVTIVAASAALTPQGIAFNEVQRQAIMLDPRWQYGDYAPGQEPASGLAIARMLAMITYQSEEAMQLRFSRRPALRGDIPSPTQIPDLGLRFDIENYLYYQGRALVQRFDANSYLYLSRAMDLYNVSAGYSTLEHALRRIRSRMLFIGIRSDFLFPPAHVRDLARRTHDLGKSAHYVEIDSPHGHDAFLKEWDLMTQALKLWHKENLWR